MKSSMAVLALAASVVSVRSNDTIVYPTEVDVYTTVCPANATITYNGHIYTNTLTKSSTITITNCPCTVVKRVTPNSTVLYSSCPESAKTTLAGPIGTPAGPGSPGTAYSNPLTIIYSTGGVVAGVVALAL